MPPSACSTSPPSRTVLPPPISPSAWPASPNDASTPPGPAACTLAGASTASPINAPAIVPRMAGRTRPRGPSCAIARLEPELAPVLPAVLVLLLLDAGDVRARLGERDVLVGRELVG